MKALYQNDGHSVSPLTPPQAACSSEKTFRVCLCVCLSVCVGVCLQSALKKALKKYKSSKVMITLALTL